MFRCEPYRADLMRLGCARRWKEANREARRSRGGKGGNSFEVFAENDLRDLKYEHCKGCPIGQRHATELLGVLEDEAMKRKKCSKCGAIRQRLLREGICRVCAGTHATHKPEEKKPRGARTKPRTQKDRPPVLLWMDKAAAIEDMKRRHADELREAEDELSDFEEDNPEIKDDAGRMLKRLLGPDLPIALPPHEPKDEAIDVTPIHTE